MSHLSEKLWQNSNFGFQGYSEPLSQVLNASSIPNLTWGIDLGKAADKKSHEKQELCKFVKRYERSK